MKPLLPSIAQMPLRRPITQEQMNLARASAVYENKTLITLESKSTFRFAEFRKLADR